MNFRLIGACTAALAMLATIAIPATSSAQVNDVLRLQGRLLSKAGTPVPDGDYGMEVAFYKGKADTKSLFTYTAIGVKVKGGVFSLSVGEKQPLPVKHFQSGNAAWVGIKVGSDAELPRVALHKVPYSLVAGRANDLNCTGCVSGAELDPKVVQGINAARGKALAPYAKTADLHKVAKSGSYSDLGGKPILVALTACKTGEYVRGYKADGTPICTADKDTDTKYSGKNFATSGQACKTNFVVGGVDSNGKVICRLDLKGNVSGKDFALSNQACKAGQHVAGIGKDGKVICATDKTHSLKTLDARYVNENQANSVTGAMVKDSTLTGADVANESLTGSDIKNSTLTGSDVANESLTGSDIKNSTLTGSDVANESLTGSDIKNSSLTGSDVANESLTGSDIKNGSIGRVDVNTKELQRRVTGTCGNGKAIGGVKEDGSVNCVATGGGVPITGKVASGIWYRIAQSNGGSASGVFTVYDTTYHSKLKFRVSVVQGVGNSYGMTVNLIEHSHNARVFNTLRVVERASSNAVYVELRADRTANVWAAIEGNGNVHKFSSAGWKLMGTKPTYSSGYSVREYPIDYKASWGDTGSQVIIDRVGRVGIGQSPAYPLHVTRQNGNNWQARFTSGSRNTYVNHASGSGVHINTGVNNTSGTYGLEVRNNQQTMLLVRNDGNFYSGGKHIRDANGGWVRTHGKTGWYNNTYGGGMHMQDSTYVRVSSNKQLHAVGNINTDNWFYAGAGEGLRWKDNAFGGTGDAAYIQYYRESGENTKLRILNHNDADDDIELYQAGGARLNVYNGKVGINNTKPSYTLDVNGTTRLNGDVRGGSSNGMTRFRTGSGYVEIGPANSTHAHIQTDRSNFYFNREIRVDSGIIGSYNEDLYLRRAGTNRLRAHTSGGHLYGNWTADKLFSGGKIVAKGGSSCGSGDAIYGFNSNGDKLCRQTMGTTYTAWGRTSCPYGTTVYSGIVGGPHNTHRGSGANYLCLPYQSNYGAQHYITNSGDQNGALIYGGEYQTSGWGNGTWNDRHDREPACAVCYVEHKTTQFMQPGRTSCPSGYTRAYFGNLMAMHYTQYRSEFICVSSSFHYASGAGKGNQDGALLYPTEYECGSLSCKWGYVQNREASCSVCVR